MAENKMAEVAKLFGKKLNERFTVRCRSISFYRKHQHQRKGE